MILVLTFTVMGIKMGVDAEQIAEVMNLDGAKKRAPALHHVHEKIPFGHRQVAYRVPKALLLKERSTPYAVVVDNPDDLTVVNVQSIQPLPPLIARHSGTCAFWGVIAENDGIILLVDFSRLEREKMGNG